MIGIARLGTNDLERARRFYDEIFALAGIGLMHDTGKACVWGKAGDPLFIIGLPYNGETATAGNGTMIGLPLGEPGMVDAIHARALSLGGQCEGPPGLRGDAANGFHAAYLRDLDGNKLCFFHRKTA
jgi:catechol 2,3-dioxygenase-like lactoylglutathione lyase family enzyme